VAAAYFPPTQPTFKDIQDKFKHDFEGVEVNGVQAFAFFVNRSLTISERQELLSACGAIRAEIYHLERIRSLLDAPKGCGIRLQYLRIPMTEAEQWAFWSSMNQDVVRKLVDQEARQDAHFQAIGEKLSIILERTRAFEYALQEAPSHLTQKHVQVEGIEMPTASLSITMTCWLHRVITENDRLPEAVRGRLRSVQSWIGPDGSSPATATYLPPSPERIMPMMNDWIYWWRAQHGQLRSQGKDQKVAALAQFHHRFLQIHPFIDGNGRVARILLDQAARELLNQGISAEFTNNVRAYYAGLVQADTGNLRALEALIAAALV
jgi:hypothetical protein